ncbi:hypothetical protein SNE40_012319 [Patella caerulea]|uniref:Uncharacterized protein n=1 Tax=Patella caerulea TaxID=87958 RepID=A0AAN8JPN2_PATCE
MRIGNIERSHLHQTHPAKISTIDFIHKTVSHCDEQNSNITSKESFDLRTDTPGRKQSRRTINVSKRMAGSISIKGGKQTWRNPAVFGVWMSVASVTQITSTDLNSREASVKLGGYCIGEFLYNKIHRSDICKNRREKGDLLLYSLGGTEGQFRHFVFIWEINSCVDSSDRSAADINIVLFIRQPRTSLQTMLLISIDVKNNRSFRAAKQNEYITF